MNFILNRSTFVCHGMIKKGKKRKLYLQLAEMGVHVFLTLSIWYKLSVASPMMDTSARRVKYDRER